MIFYLLEFEQLENARLQDLNNLVQPKASLDSSGQQSD